MTDMPAIAPADITGLVLAGGQGTRMGGVDKGLQLLHDAPLALLALRRLAPQVGTVLVNANRHLAAYRAWGAPVCPDTLPGFAGPLAGFLAGLEHCRTPWMLTVPCDSPFFPADLAARLAAAAQAQGADLAIALAPDGPGTPALLRPQPVFCLLRSALRHSLADFVAAGGHKVGAWAAQHACAQAPFDRPGDDPRAFANINTLTELQHLAAAPGNIKA